MGWKCCLLFVGDVDSGYFGTRPKHLPEKSRAIIKALGHKVEAVSDESVMDIYPDGSKVVVGAYEKGAYVAYTKIADDLEYREEEYLRRAMSCYPGGDLLALALHSVVDYSAFAYYQKGELRRSFACAADPGLVHQTGEKLPEEVKAWEGSFERDGETVFPRKFDNVSETFEYNIAAVGEEVVFALAARPLGKPLDQFDEETLSMEEFTLKPAWKFW